MTNVCVPKQIEAGVTLSLKIEDPVAGVVYTLLLRGPESINVDAINGVFVKSADETAAFPAGEYAYAIRANNPDGVVGYIQRGNVAVAPNFEAIEAGADLRTDAERALDAIRAVLLNRATTDQQKYKINNRELERTPIPDLLKLRAMYAREVRRERGGGPVIREHAIQW